MDKRINKNDRQEIDNLTTVFFDIFTNANGRVPNLGKIRDLFISEALIICNNNGSPEIYNLEEFITPRAKLLTNGTLMDFLEREISHETKIFRNVAHRLSLYEKSGLLNGIAFKAKGVKTIQFVKVNTRWKMSSVAWTDEI